MLEFFCFLGRRRAGVRCGGGDEDAEQSGQWGEVQTFLGNVTSISKFVNFQGDWCGEGCPREAWRHCGGGAGEKWRNTAVFYYEMSD